MSPIHDTPSTPSAATHPQCRASLGLAPEGLPTLGLLALTTLTLAALRWWPPALVCMGLTWFTAFFFRDPERVVPVEPGLGISPADGKIVRLERRPDPITGADCLCVSIFMNVFSVHVNRAPVAGRVEAIRYTHGSFVNAALDKASTDNERCAYLFRDEQNRPWVVVQIAGLIARRIVCRVRPDERLARGERFGLIRFGSRLDVYLPADHQPTVAIGDKVFAGETVIARLHVENEQNQQIS